LAQCFWISYSVLKTNDLHIGAGIGRYGLRGFLRVLAFRAA